MKLIDMIVERSLLASQRFNTAVILIQGLALELSRTANVVSQLIQRVLHHEQVLSRLLAEHDAIAEKMQESSLDMSLPENSKKDEKLN